MGSWIIQVFTVKTATMATFATTAPFVRLVPTMRLEVAWSALQVNDMYNFAIEMSSIKHNYISKAGDVVYQTWISGEFNQALCSRCQVGELSQ